MLAQYLRPQWKRATLMAALLSGSIAFQVASPQILRQFLDQVTQGAAGQAILRTALLFLAIVLAGQAISALASIASAVVGWEATNRLRADLALHCLKLDQRFHQSHLPGEMIERIDGDVGLLGNFFSQFTIQVAGNGLLVLAILLLIWSEDWRAGALLTAYVAAAFPALLRFQNVNSRVFDLSREQQSRAVGWFEELLTAREDFKPLGVGAYTRRRTFSHLRGMFGIGRRSLVLFRLTLAVYAVVFVLGNALAFTAGALLYERGAITIGSVFMLLAYTNLLAGNLGNIANQAGDFQQAVVAIRRVTALIRMESAVRDGPGAAPVRPMPAVEFREVSFAYAEGTPVLRRLSFRLEGGQSLGLLGRTGSGKSTLVRLLFRFYDPTQGTISLDGVDLRQMRLADLRAAVGMVTQEVQLFHATARENLSLFDENISDERILQVLSDLGLDAWLESLPDGLDTLLAGDSGLSAGESQLLALARVFLQDPHIVILDEASSRLDPATEALLEGAIDRLLAGRTAILIAHRLHTLRRVDQVLLLEDGCLLENGDRRRLATNPSSRFHRLLQAGAEVVP